MVLVFVGMVIIIEHYCLSLELHVCVGPFLLSGRVLLGRTRWCYCCRGWLGVEGGCPDITIALR